ncbi:MAG: hypothetical protein RIS63_1391, partial [Bacteroidota bacterium]
GVVDSTVILHEVFRKYQAKKTTQFLGKTKAAALVFQEKIRRTVLNPYTRTEKEAQGQQFTVFAEGYGLVSWYNRNKTIHYRLERVLSQKEWIQIISR